MHPHPKTTHTPSKNELDPVLKYIREHFYDGRTSDYHRDHRQLLQALTWPAAWLDRQALVITPKDYNQLLLKKLRQIQKHGNTRQYRPVQSGVEGAYFPKYLMKALQDHCRHHQERIYLKLKHASYTIDWIAKDIRLRSEGATHGQVQHTQTLAAAHQLLSQKQRSQKTNTDQMTLGL